ncbi:hypothetical protein [Bosea sp. LjRoot237]|uniref:hypothetical protein n=1 Tax=Bosea sp. LjRoot237 TaxID=3342292 RepID=UPI003ECE7813
MKDPSAESALFDHGAKADLLKPPGHNPDLLLTDQRQRRQQRRAVIRPGHLVEVLKKQLNLTAIGVGQAGEQPRDRLAEIAEADQPEARRQIRKLGLAGILLQPTTPQVTLSDRNMGSGFR